jgi:DNA-directed RNA polymerase alpha subunit
MEMQGGPASRKRRKSDNLQQSEFLSLHVTDPEYIERLQATSLAEVGLPVRTINTLEENEILTLGQLCQLTTSELQSIPNLGKVTVDRCREILDRLHLPNRLSER